MSGTLIDVDPEHFAEAAHHARTVRLSVQSAHDTWTSALAAGEGMAGCAHSLAELAEILASPEGAPLAVKVTPEDPSGWNDDRTRPYDAAYNAQLLIDHPQVWWGHNVESANEYES